MAWPVGKLLWRNMSLKLLALLLAVLLWYLAAGQERMESGFVIPVEFSNVPDNVAIEENSLEFVHVRVRGSRSAIQSLSQKDINARLDLKSIKPGDLIIPIDNQSIHLPRGVELLSVSPPYLSVKAAARRLVPVRVQLRGRPAEGYEVLRHTVIPGKIFVIGPPHKVSIIRDVITFPISVRGATSSLNMRAELVSPDPEVRLMEMKPTEVSVIIQGRVVDKVFRNVPVLVPGATSEGQAVPKVQVTLSGPFDVLDRLSLKDLHAEVGAGGEGEERSVSRPVKLSVPEGVNVKSVSPAEITVMFP